MVTVKVKMRGDDIVEVEAKGHAGYAKFGKDIVCSAASAVMQTALLGLIDVSGARVEHKLGDDGYLFFKVPEPLRAEEGIRQQAIVKAMMLGLRDLEKGYKAYLKTEVK